MKRIRHGTLLGDISRSGTDEKVNFVAGHTMLAPGVPRSVALVPHQINGDPAIFRNQYRHSSFFYCMTLINSVALLSLIISSAFAVWIAIDENHRPQRMAVMNAVWPITALYAGPLALWAYLSFGRADDQHAREDKPDNKEKISAASIAKGTTHCGAGCTIGDIIAETMLAIWPGIALGFGWKTLWHDRIFSGWILDFLLAFVIGIAFQYWSIKPMHPEIGPSTAMVRALKADALSLTSWQIGMYAVMALAHFVIFPRFVSRPLPPAGIMFWWIMQFAMMAGFLTAYPVNRWLISRGIKEAM